MKYQLHRIQESCCRLVVNRVIACTASTIVLVLATLSAVADDWPQWRGPNRDGVWNEKGVLDEFPAEGLEPLWVAKIGSGYSGPTVADGRVFVTDRVRQPRQVERILCFDLKTGAEVWNTAYECTYTVSYEAGPRASVTVDGNNVYALGAMGHLHCLDAGTGQVLWKRDLAADFNIDKLPIWGIAGAPLIYDDLVIIHCGGRKACIVALNKKNGDTKWTALSDRASYTSPIVIRQAGQDVVVCWTGDSVSGLHPESGKVHWRYPFPPTRMPIGIATPIIKNNRIYVTSFYDGSLMLKLSDSALTAELDWQRQGADEKHTDGLHSIISTPIWLGDHIFGVDSYGELRCLQDSDGKRLWEDQTATPRARWSTIHFVQNGENTWMFNERGELLIGTLSRHGFVEKSRTKLIDPTTRQLRQRGGVCWAHPAFADRKIFVRNDGELRAFDLRK
jgi:outer membrane protein assembly factor BamB